MKPQLLSPTEEFHSESFSAFEKRYIGFGKDLFLRIKDQIPEVFTELRFYQRKPFQSEDSYAEYCHDGKVFVIQLDPLCEVIVLWNDHTSVEIGTWSSNEYDEALQFIISDLLAQDQ